VVKHTFHGINGTLALSIVLMHLASDLKPTPQKRWRRKKSISARVRISPLRLWWRNDDTGLRCMPVNVATWSPRRSAENRTRGKSQEV